MSKHEKFVGLVAAPFTPMDANGKINTALIPEYYSFLEKNSIAGAFVNGSTGEGPSMTQKEKQISAMAWAECYRKGGSIRIINLVGGTSYEECMENAVFSKEAGYSAIAVLAPYYFKPSGVEALAEFVTRIGEAVPDMPLYFYHIPALTGVFLPMADFLEKISGMLPGFAGIKYTHEDFMDFLKCLSFGGGKYDMLWGRDECLLPALSLGCRGAVGSTYNYSAPLYHSIIDAFDSGDLLLARKLQLQSIEMIGLLGKYGGIATGKAFMRYIGLDCGGFRSPVRNMDSEAYKMFARDADALGIGSLFSKI